MAAIWNSPWDKNNEWYNKMLASGQYWNDFDLSHASQDQNFANNIFSYKQGYANAKNDYNAATTPEARALAQAAMQDWNNKAETERARYNYSSGSAGDQYNQIGGIGVGSNPIPFTGMSANWIGTANDLYGQMLDYPDWQHSDWYNKTAKEMENWQPFSYDYSTDPLYGVYKKEYTREGQRASADALAQAAMMTGGVPSSYAQTAAQQAGNYYASQIADKIPELRNQAYNEWQGNFNNLLSRYNSAYNNDQFDYGVYSDKYNRLAGLESEARNNYRNEYADMLDQAAIRAQLGDYGGYDSAWGTGLQDLYNAQTAIYGYGSDGSSYQINSPMGQQFLANAKYGDPDMVGADGSTWHVNADGTVTITRKDGRTYTVAGQTAEPQFTASQGLDLIKSGVTDPNVLAAYEYWFGAPYSGQLGGGGGRGYGLPVADLPTSEDNPSMLSQEQWDNLFQSVHTGDPNENRAAARAALNQYAPYLNTYQKTTLAHLAGIDAEALEAAGGVDAMGIDTITDLTNMLYPYEEQQTPNMQFGSGVHAKQFNDVMGQIQRDINSKNYTDAEYRLNQLLSNPSLSEAQYNQIMQYFENNKDIGVK